MRYGKQITVVDPDSFSTEELHDWYSAVFQFLDDLTMHRINIQKMYDRAKTLDDDLAISRALDAVVMDMVSFVSAPQIPIPAQTPAEAEGIEDDGSCDGCINAGKTNVCVRCTDAENLYQAVAVLGSGPDGPDDNEGKCKDDGDLK